MSKICFLTDRLPTDSDPFSFLIWNQFLALAESQHDVLIVTNAPVRGVEHWTHPRLQIIEPFGSWSIRYLPRFVQLLAHHKPDVLHWVEPRAMKFNHLQWMTPAIAALRKRPVLAMSLWNPQAWEKSWVLAATMPAMDLVFVTHPAHREMLWQRWPRMMSRVHVSPFLFDAKSASGHWVTTWAHEFDFVPGDLADIDDDEGLADALEQSLRMNGERKAIIPVSDRERRFRFLETLRDRELDARVAVFENLDWPTWHECLLRAREIRADVLRPKSPYLSLSMQWSLAHSKPILIKGEQQELLAAMNRQDAFNFLSRAYLAALKAREAGIN